MYKDILGEEEDFDSSTLTGLTVQDFKKSFTLNFALNLCNPYQKVDSKKIRLILLDRSYRVK